MQMKERDETVAGLIGQLEVIAAELEQVVPIRVGYRDRVRIERPLFLVLKEICLRHLGFDLHGLTDVHRQGLRQCIARRPCSSNLLHFIRHVYEFRVFLLELTSADPYVQGNALSLVLETECGSVAFLSRQLRILAKEAREAAV